MKIAQVMASSGEGGLEKHFVELCNGLAAQGHQVYALCLNKYKGQLSDQVTFVDIDLTGSRHNPLTIMKLFSTLKKIDADILHAQANKAGQLLAPILPHLNAKSVVTIHNIKKKLGFIAGFDLAIGVSKGVVAKFPSSTNSAVVYNGIKIPASSESTPANLPANLDRSKLTALSIGRLVPAKGFDILIDACKDIDCNILIAGDGPDKALLEQLIAKHQLSHKVFLLGHRTDIPDLISFVDFVVISSRKEGFSYAFSEALLLNKPVLSTDVPIPNEVLPPDFIAAIDSEQLAKKLVVTLEERNHWHTTFAPIFEYAKNNLTFEKQIKNSINEYQKLM